MTLQNIARAISGSLISPNVSDGNFEAANVVDVLHRLALAGEHQAEAAAEIGKAILMHAMEVRKLAEAIRPELPVRSPHSVTLPK